MQQNQKEHFDGIDNVTTDIKTRVNFKLEMEDGLIKVESHSIMADLASNKSQDPLLVSEPLKFLTEMFIAKGNKTIQRQRQRKKNEAKQTNLSVKNT